jgi:PIN domain-containing protein
MPDPSFLLFIDTNIFLDFYRATRSADFKLLGRLKEVHDKIISSGQVEMEFQKNRQKRLLTSFQNLNLSGRPEIPGLFVNSTEGEELNAAFKRVENSLEALKNSLSAAMNNPAEHDPVYNAANDVFSVESDFNLTHVKQQRYRIHRLA